MEANNAEQTTEVSTESATTETSVANTEVPAIEEGNTSIDESSSSEESTESTEAASDLVYDFDGEEVSASTVKEWRDNGLRQSDYTKKSQANADMKKALEAKSAEIDEVKTNLSERITALDSIIESQSNPDELIELRDTDPSEYLRRKEEIAEKQKLSEQSKKELEALKKAEDDERINKEQQLLLDALPTWQDPKQRDADIALIDSYTKESGLTDSDFNAIQSHKLMIMALDAAKYQALQKDAAETEKQVEKAPNVVKARVKQVDKTKTNSVAERFYGK
jgi:hypothetical protein